MYNYPHRLCFYFTMTMYMNLYYLIVNMKLRDMKQLPNRSIKCLLITCVYSRMKCGLILYDSTYHSSFEPVFNLFKKSFFLVWKVVT